jgi:hypothetical protein
VHAADPASPPELGLPLEPELLVDPELVEPAPEELLEPVVPPELELDPELLVDPDDPDDPELELELEPAPEDPPLPPSSPVVRGLPVFEEHASLATITEVATATRRPPERRAQTARNEKSR